MRSVAIVGAGGYVGSALAAALARHPSYNLVRVTRENYVEAREGAYDILVNAAMPSGRFFAKNNPMHDFAETVQKTADLFYGWQFKKFVQISTVSARCQLETVYGRHKAAAERICSAGEHLIIRLGPMYSPDLAKGVLVDMMEGRTVFAHAASRYCFAPLAFVAEWIASHLDRSGVVEVGAKNALALSEVVAYLGKTVSFEGALDHQEIENPAPEFPDARDVFAFLDDFKR